jgi:hypothetical protein
MKINNRLRIATTKVALLAVATVAHAHGGVEHKKVVVPIKARDKVLDHHRTDEMALAYKRDVEPIFAKKCLACHGLESAKPWYYSIPGPHQLIDQDIDEARSHIRMENGFPFDGHGTVKGDLEAIRDAIAKDEMPPMRYRIMHADSLMSDAEKTAVFKWIDHCLSALPETAPQAATDKPDSRG